MPIRLSRSRYPQLAQPASRILVARFPAPVLCCRHAPVSTVHGRRRPEAHCVAGVVRVTRRIVHSYQHSHLAQPGILILAAGFTTARNSSCSRHRPEAIVLQWSHAPGGAVHVVINIPIRPTLRSGDLAARLDARSVTLSDAAPSRLLRDRDAAPNPRCAYKVNRISPTRPTRHPGIPPRAPHAPAHRLARPRGALAYVDRTPPHRGYSCHQHPISSNMGPHADSREAHAVTKSS
ncbi:hypothetical protein AAG906_007580 [Vitis piasezkii]